jgi:hypothetical protein
MAHLKKDNLKAMIKNIICEIDQIIRKNKWFDFHVLQYDSRKMIVAGGADLTYYHNLELIFEDIFFVSAYFNGWHTDTDKAVIEIPDVKLNKDLNIKFDIEQGYQLFIIHTEDYNNDIYIAAKRLTFNTDTVYYYEREGLKENERLADFIKTKK